MQEATQSHAVVGLVSAGIGVALVPASTQSSRLGGVQCRPLAEKSPPVLTALAWRRGDASPVVAAFLKTAREVAGAHYPLGDDIVKAIRRAFMNPT